MKHKKVFEVAWQRLPLEWRFFSLLPSTIDLKMLLKRSTRSSLKPSAKFRSRNESAQTHQAGAFQDAGHIFAKELTARAFNSSQVFTNSEVIRYFLLNRIPRGWFEILAASLSGLTSFLSLRQQEKLRSVALQQRKTFRQGAWRPLADESIAIDLGLPLRFLGSSAIRSATLEHEPGKSAALSRCLH